MAAAAVRCGNVQRRCAANEHMHRKQKRTCTRLSSRLHPALNANASSASVSWCHCLLACRSSSTRYAGAKSGYAEHAAEKKASIRESNEPALRRHTPKRAK